MVRHGEGPEHPRSPRCDGCHDDDVTRLAEMLGGVAPWSSRGAAQRLLNRGVTLPPPPPDFALAVTRAIRDLTFPEYANDPFPDDKVYDRLLAAVRDLFTTDALEAAAAKVQKAKAPTVKCPVWCVRPKGHDGDHLAIPAGSDRFA